jgi:metal-responsive CopG/Arc/MetJ family transcriptional regulator
MATNAPQDDWHKTGLRLPKELHAQLHEAAAKEGRSYNSEIVARLQRSFEAERETAKDTVITRVYKVPEDRMDKPGKEWTKDELERVISRLGKIVEDFRKSSEPS